MLNIIEQIGKGSYGKIYKIEKDDKEQVIKINMIEKDCSYNYSLKELDILTKIKHPCLVSLKEVLYDVPETLLEWEKINRLKPSSMEKKYKKDNICFIMEKGEKDLSKFISDNISEKYYVIKLLMLQISIGLEYLHSKKIIHRDIKPNNIIYYNKGDNCWMAKICDFGFCKYFYNQKEKSPRIQVPCYRSPEILLNKEYDEKIDVWSLGCVFYELVREKC